MSKEQVESSTPPSQKLVDVRTHKWAYAACGFALPLGVGSVILTFAQNGGFAGPTLLSLSVLLVGVGLVSYQAQDARRTYERLDAIKVELDKVVAAHEDAMSSLESATTAATNLESATESRNEAKTAYEAAAEGIRSAETALRAAEKTFVRQQEQHPRGFLGRLGLTRR